jgi:diguanylate cyclase (GGDEF)-like protein
MARLLGYVLAGLLVVSGIVALPRPLTAGLSPSKSLTQYRLDVWTSDDLLPQNSIMAIIQTRDGYLWVATQDGLARFDGVHFTIFDASNTAELRDGFCRVLFEDREGHLWIGTELGGLTRYRDGSFRHYGPPEGLPAFPIRAIAQDKSGILWVGTEGGGLARLTGDRFEQVKPGGDEQARSVGTLAPQSDGSLWIGTRQGLLRRQPDGDFAAVPAAAGDERLSVSAILEDRHGLVWVGTPTGLRRFRFDGRILQPLGDFGGLDDAVSCILEDGEGTIWVGTAGKGLARIRGAVVDFYGTAEGLSDDYVLAVLQDREGSLWIGTDIGGLARLRDPRIATFDAADGLSHNAVWTVAETRDGTILVGTDGGGLNKLENGRFRVFPLPHPGTNVTALLEASDGSLWVGTQGRGVVRVRNGKTRTFTNRDGLVGNSITALHQDPEGTIWLGGRGLTRYRDGKFSDFHPLPEMARSGVSCILTDRQRRLWIGTTRGLFRFDGQHTQAFSDSHGLSSSQIFTLIEDAAGSIWIGTAGGGICRMRDDRAVCATTRDGLFNNSILQILEDDTGGLWMGSNKGIFRVPKDELDEFLDGRRSSFSLVSYSTADGLKRAECSGGTQPAAWKDSKGRLWFSTIRGVAMIDPASFRRNLLPPPVHIEKVRINGTEFSPQLEPSVPPGRGDMEFHYTALSFVDPAHVQFKYRLEGFQTEWVDAGNRRVAYYTNIPPAQYRFQVIASNNDGVWNLQGDTYRFYLTPSFHQTFGFYLLVGSLLLAAGSGLYVLRLRQFTGKQRTLEALVEERTGALEEANRQLERLAVLDELTHLANHRRCREFLDQQWRLGFRHARPLSVIMIDVDHFKAFNDSLGHLAGDQCLRDIGRALGSTMQRAGDLVGRYGGEEFLVVLGGMGATAARQIAESLRTKVEALSIRHPSSPTADVVTISLGVATVVPSSACREDDLLRAADTALYRAKQEGRNKVVVARPPAPATITIHPSGTATKPA